MDGKLQAKKFFIESAKSDLLLKTAKSEWMETARPKTKRHHNFFLTSQSGRDVNLIQQEICVDKILKSAQENFPFDKKNVIPIQFTSSTFYMLPPFTDRVAERSTTGG